MQTTMLALLWLNEGRPVMPLKDVAELMGIGEKTAENKIYAQEFPLPVFKLGSKWVCHVHDVASHIDAQRADAMKLLQQQKMAA